MQVTWETNVEPLVEEHPKAARFLARHGLLCMVCGGTFWGTLGELVAQENYSQPDTLLDDLNTFLAEAEARA